MKIAFLHHVFQMGSGIEQVILELATHLKAMGHDTVIITYKNEYPTQTAVPVVEFLLPSATGVARSVLSPVFSGTNRDIRGMLDAADIAVTSLYPMSVVPLWPRKVKSRVVFIEWGVQPYSAFGSPLDKSYLWLLNRMDRYATKRSDKVLVANEVTKQWVEEQGVHPVKLQLYGINFDRLNLDTDYGDLYTRHRELDGSQGIIMYAGRQSPHKNIELLINAVGILKRRQHNVKLLVVGRDSFPGYARQLRELVHQTGLDNNVMFTGLVSEEDLAKYYNLCDVFVNASKWEGFLNPEPYAFKKPIIAYGVPPHDETVKNGVTGTLVGKLTAEDFAVAIGKMLIDKRAIKMMGEAGYKWAKENLDYRVVAQNFAGAIAGNITN